MPACQVMYIKIDFVIYSLNLKIVKIMFEINPVKLRIQDVTARTAVLRGYL
jgi:hypothetical protein